MRRPLSRRNLLDRDGIVDAAPMAPPSGQDDRDRSHRERGSADPRADENPVAELTPTLFRAAAGALPSGAELAKLFPGALARRAAEHIRINAADPAAGIPDDDHDLVSFITGLLTVPCDRIAESGLS